MWPVRLSAVVESALAGPPWPCKDGHMSTDDLKRLAEAVKRRRLALGLARLAAAKHVGISKDSWKRVEEALPARDMTYAAVDQALGWEVGSCLSIAAGGSPTLAEQSAADPSVTLTDGTGAGRDAAVRRVVESASIATTNLPASEIRELSARILGDLKREGVI